MTDLIDIIVAKKMEPLAQDLNQTRAERLENMRRENLKAIAAKDPRILDQRVFDAINAKLQENPELWNLKNPHKAAWLEVKEEMRLGEPTTVPAQPSKPASPILGGGSPPPPQSSVSGLPSPDILRQAISKADFKDKVQAEALEKAAKAYFDSTMA